MKKKFNSWFEADRAESWLDIMWLHNILFWVCWVQVLKTDYKSKTPGSSTDLGVGFTFLYNKVWKTITGTLFQIEHYIFFLFTKEVQ